MNKIDTPEAHDLVNQYFALKEQIEDTKDFLTRLQNESKDILHSLSELSHDQDATIGPHKLTKVERKGTPSYATIVKEHLPDLDLTPYRGAPSSYWKLT